MRTIITGALPLLTSLLFLPSLALAQERAEAPRAEPPAVAPETEGSTFDLADYIIEGGLTADQVAARAVAAAPSAARSRAAVAIAEAGATRARLALWPRLDLSARYTRLSDVAQGGFGTPVDPEQRAAADQAIMMVSDPPARELFRGIVDQLLALGSFEFPTILDQFSLRAGLSYPVSDLFFVNLPLIEAADSFAEAERVSQEVENANIALEAREAFYSWIRAQGARAVADAQMSGMQSERDRLAILVEAGTATRVDLMRLDAQLASLRVSVAQSQAGVEIAEAGLRLLIDEPTAALAIGEDPTPGSTRITGDVEQFVRTAQNHRPELRALRAVAEAQGEMVTANAGRRWPRFSLSASAELANPNQRVFPQSQEFTGTWDISASLSWSPNDYFMANAEIDRTEAELAQTRADLDNIERALRLEVSQALATYRAGGEAIDAAVVFQEVAEAVVAVRQRELDVGSVTATDLINAQTDLTRARLQYLDAIVDFRIARARLSRATGSEVR